MKDGKKKKKKFRRQKECGGGPNATSRICYPEASQGNTPDFNVSRRRKTWQILDRLVLM